MRATAYIKNDMLCLHFNQSSMLCSRIESSLGMAITQFSALSEIYLRDILKQLRQEFLFSARNQETDEEFFSTQKMYVVALSDMTPYFNFYMDAYVAFLVLLKKQMPEVTKSLRSFLLHGDNVDLSGFNFNDIDQSSKLAIDAFMIDLKKRQTRLKEDFDVVTSGMEEYEELTPMQRLYMLSKQGRNYLSGEFKTVLAPDYLFMPSDDLEKIKSTLLKNEVDIVEMVEIRNLEELLNFEMYHTLKANLLIRKCKYCGEYFIVTGRIDMEYCDRIKDGETKPCSVIGAIRNYWGSKEGDPVYAEFQQAYKRNHSRRRVGKMTQTEFYKWSEEARKKRGECEAGVLSLEEFRRWLGNKR